MDRQSPQGGAARGRRGTRQHRCAESGRLLEVCIVRAIVVLTNHGISAGDAIWFAQDGHLSTVMRSALDNYGMSTIIAFERPLDGGAPKFETFVNVEETVGSFVGRSDGIVTVLDLKLIVEHVCSALNGAERMAEAS